MPTLRNVDSSPPPTARTSPAWLPVIVLLLSMGACATIPPDGAQGPPMSGQCNADGARWAIGRAPDNDVVERARVESDSATVRVIRPGDVVTMDVRIDRLNLDVNARNAIDGVKCG